jgi:DNA-binding transcriptional regulator YiaG
MEFSEKDLLIERLKEEFLDSGKVESYAHLARLLSKAGDRRVPPHTVGQWLKTGKGPRTRSHQAAIKKLLEVDEIKYEENDGLLFPRLERALKERGMTKRELARNLGIPSSTVRDWFLHNSEPRKNSHQRAVQEFLEGRRELEAPKVGKQQIDKGQERVLPSASSKNLEIRARATGSHLVLILPHLSWFVKESDSEVRRTLRREMGEENFKRLLNCIRALSSEMARKKVLEENPGF